MATKTQAAPVTEAAIKAAVQTWAKAETSAIWALIRLVNRGLIGFEGPNRKTRLSGLKAQVMWAANETWGEGAAQDRAAHISKIFTIAENATPAHFERWSKQGTGFYKAYSEFAVPQRAKTKIGNGAGTTGKSPETVKVPAQAVGIEPATPPTGEKLKVDEPDAGIVKPTEGQPTEGYAKTGAGTEPIQSLPAPDPTEGWAARIDVDRGTWNRLLDRMTEKKHTILEPGMVLAVLQAASKKLTLFRNSIGVILQDEYIKAAIVEWIKENIVMFDGLSVEAGAGSQVDRPALSKARETLKTASV